MNIEQLKAATLAAKEKAEASEGKDESLNQALKDAEVALAEAEKEAAEGKNIDFEKLLEEEKGKLPPPQPKRSEKEKAKFTIDKIYERFPDLKEEEGFDEEESESSKLRQELLRNQVEGIIRQGCKTESEVKFKMHFYDNMIVKTGKIHGQKCHRPASGRKSYRAATSSPSDWLGLDSERILVKV